MIFPVSKTTEVNPIIPAESADTSFQKKHNAHTFVGEAERAFKSEMNRQGKKENKANHREEAEEHSESAPEIFALLIDRDFHQLLLAFNVFGSCDIPDLIYRIRQLFRTNPVLQMAGLPKYPHNDANATDVIAESLKSHYSRNLEFHLSRPGSVFTTKL